MTHKIVEAIIEDNQIRYIERPLPCGRIKAHIIYDTEDETVLSEAVLKRILKETSGIYKEIDAETESKKLRDSWERDVRN